MSRFEQVVGDQHDRLAKRFEYVCKFVLQIEAHHGIERAERFVQQQCIGIQHQCAHQAHPLALSPR